MISVELSRVLKESLRYAKEHRHEYLTIEHIFLSILNSEEGKDILLAIGGNIDYMRQLTVTYLKSNIPVLEINENGEVDEPYETVAISQVMNNMMMHITTSGKNEARVGDMLASILSQDRATPY